MPLLIDFMDVSEDVCDGCLEDVFKAMTEGRGARDPSNLFDRVPNRFAADHVEAVSDMLTGVVRTMESVLARFLAGHPEDLRKADVPWVRMDPARFEMVRVRLEGMTPDVMTLDDWLLLVEWILARYLPDGVIETMAQFTAVRATLLGKIEANLAGDPRVTDPLLARVVELLPTDFAHVPPKVLTPVEVSILNYGKVHAAEAIRSVSEQTRRRFANLVLQHAQAGILGQREGTWKHLATRLFDELADTNKDMRRIAVTEVGEMVNQGFIGALQPGQRVKRIEAYRQTCEFCSSINGKVFTIVSPDDPNKNWDTDIWSGKNNLGRSASPMKREGNTLVERNENERWTVTAGLIHPNCRGAFVKLTDKPPAVSIEFFNFLQSTLDQAEQRADAGETHS